METKRNIQGYLECDGTITKITSLEDIQVFVTKFGKSVDEMTEYELYELTKKKINFELDECIDDCSVRYYTNPTRLVSMGGRHFESYKVQEGTIAICEEAFKDSSLKAVCFPNSVIVIGAEAFYSNKILQTLKLSKSLLKIGNSSFCGCYKLSSLVLPRTLKIIGSNAFRHCSISEVTIPLSVHKVGSEAFYGCAKLKEVIFEGVPKEINSGIFDQCTSLEKVIVPKGSKDHFVEVLFPLGSDKIVEKL